MGAMWDGVTVSHMPRTEGRMSQWQMYRGVVRYNFQQERVGKVWREAVALGKCGRQINIWTGVKTRLRYEQWI